MNDSPKQPLFTPAARREFYERRVLVLDGVLDDDNGILLATQLIALATEDPQQEIALWIHSPGGSVPAMLAIRDIIRTIPNDVSTLALGIACSAVDVGLLVELSPWRGLSAVSPNPMTSPTDWHWILRLRAG